LHAKVLDKARALLNAFPMGSATTTERRTTTAFTLAKPEGTLLSMEKEEATLAGKLVDAVASSSNDVTALCETYQLRREELGRLTGFSLRALAEWASGKLPSQPAKRRLHEVRRLLDVLSEIVKPTSIPRWLHQSNKAFDGLTPLQVIELGEIDRLWSMVHDLGSGQPE
jgi:DNA-binding transcriptional regulator YiaG